MQTRTLKGVADKYTIATIIPHADLGAPECCGCLNAIIRGELAEIVCNECGVVVRTVALDDLRRILDEMEVNLALASARCPHCGAVHLAPGLSEMFAFVCEKCGESVEVPKSPGRLS